jgi:hypothetical protein
MRAVVYLAGKNLALTNLRTQAEQIEQTRMRFSASRNEAPPPNLVLTADDASDGLAVGNVLFGQNALRERVLVVLLQNGDRTLQDDYAVIEMLVDKMHCAASHFDAVLEGLLLRVETGKRRQQRGMNVEDAIRKRGDEPGREQAHVARKADEIDIVSAQAGDHIGVVLNARTALGGEEFGGEAEFARRGESE